MFFSHLFPYSPQVQGLIHLHFLRWDSTVCPHHTRFPLAWKRASFACIISKVLRSSKVISRNWKVCGKRIQVWMDYLFHLFKNRLLCKFYSHAKTYIVGYSLSGLISMNKLIVWRSFSVFITVPFSLEPILPVQSSKWQYALWILWLPWLLVHCCSWLYRFSIFSQLRFLPSPLTSHTCRFDVSTWAVKYALQRR